jgi:decaprenylphospho-beta-D-ribofuranose 2-oxidase
VAARITADEPESRAKTRRDTVVAENGGRIYLAKDSRLRAELLDAMYPRLDEWRKVRYEIDPDGVMQSDLSRRLGL